MAAAAAAAAAVAARALLQRRCADAAAAAGGGREGRAAAAVAATAAAAARAARARALNSVVEATAKEVQPGEGCTGGQLSERVREALRMHLAQPVSVVTAAAADGSLVGFTCGSVTPVTLSPEPVLALNVRVESAGGRALAPRTGARGFAVHLLGEGGVQLAQTFASGATNSETHSARFDRSGVAWERCVRTSAPLLRAGGVRAALLCEPLDGPDLCVGDARVVLAKVVGVDPQRSSQGDGARSSAGSPLLYLDRQYAALAPLQI